MNRKQSVTTLSLGLMGMMLLMFAGCDRFDLGMVDNNRDELDAVDPNLVSANTMFGFKLLNELRKTDQDKNTLLSPFSISVALAMMLNGAADETEQGMIRALQLQGLDAEAINTNYAQLLQRLQEPTPKVTLSIANSLWTHNADQDFAFWPDFLRRNTEFFNAEIAALDLHDPGTPAQINQWVNTQTRGKIKKIISGAIDRETGILLLNAIYFKGEWKTAFDPSRTQDAPFYLPTGEEKSVPMMRRSGHYPYYRGTKFRAISLPYGDGQIGMYIFLPSRESDLNTLLDNLDVESWENWVSQLHRQKVFVQIPKFNLDYAAKLNVPLKALGMETAFKKYRAKFSRMVYSPTGKPLLTWIQRVDQKTLLEVNEEGTVAAAVTSGKGGVEPISAPPDFIADHPFFFAIRDNQTETVLFMGVVVDPTTVKEPPLIPEPPIPPTPIPLPVDLPELE